MRIFSGASRLQAPVKGNVADEVFLSKLLNRRWALSSPDVKINQIVTLNHGESDIVSEQVTFSNIGKPCVGDGATRKRSSFYVIRDDLLHPLINGNKARKLDAVLPLLEDNGVTDVVTCGGCQSAHTAAVAVLCAERGINSHLLLRGEEPEILTGYNLVSRIYGNVAYIPRSVYAKREDMLASHAETVAGDDGSVDRHVKNNKGSKKVCIISEGAGDAVALLGLIRLIHHLSQKHLFGRDDAMEIVVDSGTGTTAIGLALGTSYMGLPWRVTGIMLADTIANYKGKEQNLISEFHDIFSTPSVPFHAELQWVERRIPRKFGNVTKHEIQECRKIAAETGVLVDPIYTLAAWDHASRLCLAREDAGGKVVMLHTGGTMGMFGLAQRYKSYFKS